MHPRARVLAVLLTLTAATAVAGWNEGMAAYQRGDYPTAAEQFSALLERSPNQHQTLFMLARCQEHLDMSAEALANVRRAVELQPDNAMYSVELANLLLDNGSATDAFDVLHHLDPAAMDAGLRVSHAQLLAASALQADRMEDALPALEGAVAEFEDNLKLTRALAAAYAKLGRESEAATAWSACFASDPEELDCGRRSVEAAIAAAERASSEDVRKRLQQLAVANSTRLAELAPSGQNLSLLVHSYAAAGDPDAACPQLESALAAGVDNDTAAWIHGRLARRCECRLDLDGAIRHHTLSGNPDRAQELRQIAGSFGEALAQRQKLADTIVGLRSTLPELERLDDQAGLEAVRGRIAALEREVASLDANLGEVRTALQSGCDDR